MTEAEIKALADEMGARAKAAKSAAVGKVKTFVVHHGISYGAGAATVFGALKLLPLVL